MTTSITFNPYENDDKRLLDNYHYLAERRCLKQHLHHTPLTLRRSISLEDTSTDVDLNLLEKTKDKHLLNLSQIQNNQLSSSLNSLCLQFRRYQLLPEYDEDVAKSSHEHDFNWWKTIAHLRPIVKNAIMSDYRKNDYFPQTSDNDEYLTFKNCKRQQRRNAVCIEIDRLYYNDQLLLFAMVANQIQLEHHLTFSGFSE
ncbi:unnamed protein product [Rotaria sordida]|uniref:Uncharacterized protein n=1 Tax=Rotaria sordida TaxID=392033 RepID=A0A813QC36_9BILA|nr:unnamed protein product [Rotaria sordida]CAF0803594.1 unnamed protein product [Rotaria sordida]CAF0827350.1 unnamed protein product [Rotaria sordida]CAF0840383.1 unnamed protein product [Rotaria sordida]CAF0841190.1 unnamed protein product [Rotaria sordida]